MLCPRMIWFFLFNSQRTTKLLDPSGISQVSEGKKCFKKKKKWIHTKTKGWNWIFMELQYMNYIFNMVYPVIIIFIHSCNVYIHLFILRVTGTSHHRLSMTGQQVSRLQASSPDCLLCEWEKSGAPEAHQYKHSNTAACPTSCSVWDRPDSIDLVQA